jgi:hypothetical protein
LHFIEPGYNTHFSCSFTVPPAVQSDRTGADYQCKVRIAWGGCLWAQARADLDSWMDNCVRMFILSSVVRFQPSRQWYLNIW